MQTFIGVDTSPEHSAVAAVGVNIVNEEPVFTLLNIGFFEHDVAINIIRAITQAVLDKAPIPPVAVVERIVHYGGKAGKVGNPTLRSCEAVGRFDQTFKDYGVDCMKPSRNMIATHFLPRVGKKTKAQVNQEVCNRVGDMKSDFWGRLEAVPKELRVHCKDAVANCIYGYEISLKS